MFLNFYGLKEQPFGVTPDGRYLYLSATHREALASLFYGLETGRGFMALVAKPGMGKTTLIFRILEKFQKTARTAFLFNTQCSSREFIQSLISELGFECRSRNFVQVLEEFNKNLVREAKQGRRCIVVIDEAQNLDGSVLETARLLSNFETSRAKLLQIVLAGQPELADKLNTPGQRQLRQRISMFNRLEAFSLDDTVKYIQHRMQIAGYRGPALFTPDALELLFVHAGGIPRNINNLCFASLSLGCALTSRTINAAVMQEAIADLDSKSLGSAQEPDAEYHEVIRKESDTGPPRDSMVTFGKLLRKMECGAHTLEPIVIGPHSPRSRTGSGR